MGLESSRDSAMKKKKDSKERGKKPQNKKTTQRDSAMKKKKDRKQRGKEPHQSIPKRNFRFEENRNTTMIQRDSAMKKKKDRKQRGKEPHQSIPKRNFRFEENRNTTMIQEDFAEQLTGDTGPGPGQGRAHDSSGKMKTISLDKNMKQPSGNPFEKKPLFLNKIKNNNNCKIICHENGNNINYGSYMDETGKKPDRNSFENKTKTIVSILKWFSIIFIIFVMIYYGVDNNKKNFLLEFLQKALDE